MANFTNHLRGADHPNWRGDDVGYAALHDWVRRERGNPTKCENCGTEGVLIEWANRSGEYHRDLDDWLALCRPCHRQHDHRDHCRAGHELTPENTYRDRRGYPNCRTCKNARWREMYRRRKEQR